ncbi:MAG TPA: hypothetical protein VGB25_05330 [Candidatus Binatia bacterium]
MDLNTAGLTVDATSRIDATGRGFPGGGKPGNPFVVGPGGSGMTAGFQQGSTGRSGGSYGGLGGSSSGSANPVYGLDTDPNEPGSGGASAAGAAGSGGGLVRIAAQTFTLNGQIKADGETTTSYGGGSGGGIRIRGRCGFCGFLVDVVPCLVVPAWTLQVSYITSWPMVLRVR